MKYIYLYIYSKFYFFTDSINEDKIYAVVAAIFMLSILPLLNVLVILRNLLYLDSNKYKNVYVISFLVLFFINFLIIFLMKEYENIEINYPVSKRSKILSNIIVIVYMLTTFIFLFV